MTRSFRRHGRPADSVVGLRLGFSRWFIIALFVSLPLLSARALPITFTGNGSQYNLSGTLNVDFTVSNHSGIQRLDNEMQVTQFIEGWRVQFALFQETFSESGQFFPSIRMTIFNPTFNFGPDYVQDNEAWNMNDVGVSHTLSSSMFYGQFGGPSLAFDFSAPITWDGQHGTGGGTWHIVTHGLPEGGNTAVLLGFSILALVSLRFVRRARS